jgi:hypothetical protein
MPLREARGIWQTVVNKVAVDCFDAAGNVDIGKLREWMEFFGNAEIFGTEPCCLIPHAKFACSQICAVLECLSDNRNGARDKLDAASHNPVSSYGQSILDVMFPGVVSPLNPATAILASLFTPHRQSSLPTCTMNSLINAEIRNYPERLIEIYAQMLGGGNQFTSPGGYAFQPQPMENGFVTVDLKNGGPRGRDKVFEAIVKGGPSEIAEQKEAWQREGIEYIELADEADRYKLKLPIHNMNDVLFDHLFQASNFGNGKIDDQTEFGTMLMYAGYRGCEAFPLEILAGKSDFLDGMTKLKEQAKIQQQLGHRYMRVATRAFGAHAENIDITALLAFDPNNMETGKAYAIGDRNYGGGSMSQDILRLAVRKVEDGNGGPPRHEIGTLRGGVFKNDATYLFRIYNTGVEVRDADYWEQFEP